MATVLPSINTWGEIPNTAIVTAQASYPIPASQANGSTPKIGFTAFSGMAVANKTLVHIGGGHTDYSGNEVIACNLGADTPGYVLLRAPTTNANIIDQVHTMADGRPVSRHTYWELHYIAALNKVFMLGAGAIAPNGGAAPWVDAFDLTTNDYVATGTYADGPSPVFNLPANAKAQVTSTGDVWCRQEGGSMWKWNASTQTFSSVHGVTPENNNTPMVHDSTRDQLIYFDSTSYKYTSLASSVTETAISFSGASASQIGNAMSAVYVADLDLVLCSKWGNTDNNIYQVQPGSGTSFAASVYSVAGTLPPKAAAGTGNGELFSRFNIVPALKLIVMSLGTTTNLWAFRYA